jgi:DNA helicase-2/ATP-dependent DNA helicase PcrA
MSHEYVLRTFSPPATSHIDFAKELNAQQHAAVTAPPGPALVIAGAGSGKTRTLIYRVAFLLEQGIPADRILLLTFTNKAAREMMRRVAELLGREQPGLWGGTFHSIGNRILRKHANTLGFAPDFTILDREDAKHLLGTCVTESALEIKGTGFPKAEVLDEIFSLSVNTHKSVAKILEEDYEDLTKFAAAIQDLQVRYATRKRAANAMDFDDLLVLWLKLLKDDADIREHYQRRFQFILVDEYQDTNPLQGELIDLLAARHRNVMVVGDDAQSIYAWRGADDQNILQFPDRYPGSTIYKIETNYRSTPEILNVANAAIAANVRQFAKQLTPARKPGNKPALVTCGDTAEQAAFVAQRLSELHEEGTPLNSIAVLYRSHFHALELQLELTRRGIPFTITSGIRFFEQAHIKDVAAYLKFVVNPRDEISFKRLVQLLPGIGGRGADKLWNAFAPKAALAARQDSSTPSPVATALQHCAGAIPKRAAVSWAQFTATVSQLESPDIRKSASEMITLVLEAGYDEYVESTYANHLNRLEDLEQLAIFANQFANTDEFLSQLALLTNMDAEDGQPEAAKDESLRLSTIHQAKGLEFDVVFVIMLGDGLFPSQRSSETDQDIEEERRLFYVAITRARNELYLSYPLVRGRPGAGGDTFLARSRFLGEIPPELLEEWNLRPFHAY